MNEEFSKLPVDVYIDAGSTQTRSCINQGEEFKGFSMPSSVGSYIPTKLGPFTASGNFEDNLYIMLDGEHYLFGSIIEMQAVATTKAGVDNKCMSRITRINCLASVAIQLLMNNIDTPPNVVIHVAVRPRDLLDPDVINDFQDSLVGKHTAVFPLLDRSVEFIVDGVVCKREPEACLYSMLKEAKEQGIKMKKAILIDGGGTSIDAITFSKGKIMLSVATNSTNGGDVILSTNEPLLSKMLTIEPTQEQLRDAGILGKVIMGSRTKDVSQFRNLVNNTIVEETKHEIQRQLTQNKTTITDIDAIAFTGRLFAEDGTNNSAIALLKETYEKYSGLTILHNSDPFIIVKGLLALDNRSK